MPRKPTGQQHTTIGKNLIEEPGKLGDSLQEGESITVSAPAKKATAARKPATKKAPAKKRAPRKPPAAPKPVYSWDQREDETAAAYLAFLVYRELGLTRSLVKVRRLWGETVAELGVKSDKPPSPTSIDLWSSKHSWVLRSSAYDKHLDREWVLEQKERRRKAAQRNADMAGQAMELVQKRIQQMTNHLDFESDSYDPEAPTLDVLDLRRLVDSLGKLERLAIGDSTENVQVTGKDGGPVKVDLTTLPAEDLVDRLKQIRESIDSRIKVIEGGDG